MFLNSRKIKSSHKSLPFFMDGTKRRKEDYSRAGVEVIVIPLAKLPEDVKEREKTLGEWVWG